MTTYLIATINIHDRDEYAKYESGFMDIFAQYSGKLLSVDETPVTLEGEWDYTRTVLIEFPSKTDATAWYESAAYQKLMQHRLAASTANLALIESPPA